MARIVCVEAWFRGSHAQWARTFCERSRHEVELLTLPGVHWAWRLHGRPAAIAADLPAAIDRLGGIDALLVSSAIDLSALLGLSRHSLVDVPALYYLHENHITFPTRPGGSPDVVAGVATWRSLLAADRVVFNSEFHQSSLVSALPTFLRQFPDHRRHALLAEIEARSSVVGVGVDVARFRGERTSGQRPRVLWNQRWEWDKDPARFVAAMERLASRGGDFELVVAGSHLPEAVVARDLVTLGDRVAHLGSAPADDYPALLRSCDIVVSTARHEFYGVAVAEAIAAGAIPVLPDGLAYRELIPRELHADLLYDTDEQLDARLDSLLTETGTARASLRDALAPSIASWDVRDRVAQLDRMVDQVIDESRGID